MSTPSFSLLARRLAAGGQAESFAIADEALERHRAGEPILLLTLGDPVCPPHPAILAATTAALAAGRTHYSPMLGEPALREAVARTHGETAAEVAILPGAQAAGFAVLSLLAGAGDEVILSDPYYATYPGVVAATGADARFVPVRPDLRLDVEAIAATITPRTRVIFVASPANPTGEALTEADYARLTPLCAEKGIWLVADEVYQLFRYGGRHASVREHGPRGLSVALGSLSKSHAMTGYRLGWAIGPAALVTALADWSAAALFGVSQFVQDAAVAALALPDADFTDYRGGFASRAALVVERANAISGIHAHMPAGGMFVMLDISGVQPDDQAFARALLDAEMVAVMPGSLFGPGGRGHVRISLTPGADVLTEALARIARFVAAR